ncbi:NADH oxidoreductase [Aureimonas sp. SA4125]|uniref:alcohol dehydrogenase catalytic domain-containing protein n=1 Tax=Aureimonas sp. SA4125 TaxID=2826993 RepID=UPI001CC469B6|nr:zinc-binding dehydrogenase [Aureimonas sp. SA4125]BDA83295.1 NADH oxidoreductase [Aureimonas sp. SA4125]
MTPPETMKALVVTGEGYAGTSTGLGIAQAGDWLELREIPVPKATGRNVLVRIGLANVNPSDVHFIKGEYGQPRRRGVPAGFEGMGVVVAAGDAAGEALIGKRVALSVVATGSGTWAEYALTDVAAVVPLAEGLRDEDAAALIVNPLSAVAMVHVAEDLGAKAFLMTAGASQLCKLIGSLAREKGMHAIPIVRREEHRALLAQMGAQTVLNSGASDYAEALGAALVADKPTVLLDAVGDQNAADIFAAMPQGAHWIVYGVLSDTPPRLANLAQLIFMGKKIEGFWLSQWLKSAPPAQREAAFTTVQRRFISGAWKTDVAATLSLGEALEKLAPALGGINKGKIMLQP